VQTRPDTDEAKSRAGRRVVGLPDQLVELLRQHRTVQEREREEARQLWHEGGWVFTTPTGRPINPNTDYREWKRLLREAGLRDARLHDARHTPPPPCLSSAFRNVQSWGLWTGLTRR
jgi:integrase